MLKEMKATRELNSTPHLYLISSPTIYKVELSNLIGFDKESSWMNVGFNLKNVGSIAARNVSISVELPENVKSHFSTPREIGDKIHHIDGAMWKIKGAGKVKPLKAMLTLGRCEEKVQVVEATPNSDSKISIKPSSLFTYVKVTLFHFLYVTYNDDNPTFENKLKFPVKLKYEDLTGKKYSKMYNMNIDINMLKFGAETKEVSFSLSIE